MDPSSLISKYQQPSCAKWRECGLSLDKLIKFLSSFMMLSMVLLPLIVSFKWQKTNDNNVAVHDAGDGKLFIGLIFLLICSPIAAVNKVNQYAIFILTLVLSTLVTECSGASQTINPTTNSTSGPTTYPTVSPIHDNMLSPPVSSHLWWLLWLLVPLSLVIFDPTSSYMVKKLDKYGYFSKLDAKTQLKVKIKMFCAIYFMTIFFGGICVIFTVFYAYGFPPSFLPTSFDVTLKLSLVLTGAIYVNDIHVYRQHLQWFTWTHHVMSLFVFTAIYNNEISFIISRFYCAVFGILLTARWPLHIASAIYYLGDPNSVNVRVFWYTFGLLMHLFFSIGQLALGTYFRITGYYQTSVAKTIFFIIFEIAVMPSQVTTIRDLYYIMKYKIFNAEKKTTSKEGDTGPVASVTVTTVDCKVELSTPVSPQSPETPGSSQSMLSESDIVNSGSNVNL